MDLHLLIDNLTNPALLFFFLGLIAVQLKSDLAIPESSGRFISFYLLLSIGFRGGQELAHSPVTAEIMWSLLFGVFLAIIIPFYTFYILRKKFTIPNSGAIAAAYGSVSAVTFVTTISFLEIEQITFGGHMVAVMALMEAPAIIVGLLLISLYDKKEKSSTNKPSMGSVVKHSFTNASVLLVLGSVVIGILASDAQAESIKPFTTDLFKGFLMIFLLDMGITSGRELTVFVKKSGFAVVFALVIPVINGVTVAIASGLFVEEVGNRLLFAILAASASYIAVPAAMKIAAPEANPSLYIPMSLAVTFPFNITLGLPLYLYIIQAF